MVPGIKLVFETDITPRISVQFWPHFYSISHERSQHSIFTYEGLQGTLFDDIVKKLMSELVY